MANKLLIVNADDFGITRGATDAILECHRAGSVTSTTLMSTQTAAAYAAAQALVHQRLGVGLHFNLTLGTSSAPAVRSSITNGKGTFFERGQLMRRALTGRLAPRDVRAELVAQYQAMRDMRLSPTHIDSHQHVHAVLPIFREVADFAAQHHLPLRLPRRWRGVVQGKRMMRQVKEGVMALGLRRCVTAMPAQIRVNDGFCSVFDLGLPLDQINMAAYRKLLAPYADGVTELMVHPADVDAELMEKTEITGVSAVEYKLLRDPAFEVITREMGFHLATYSDLQKVTI